MNMFRIDEYEAQELLSALVAIVLALTIHQHGGIGGLLKLSLDQLIAEGAVMTIVVGIGFILHELAHKFAAMHFGLYAAFRIFPMGIALMFLFSILNFGIIFLAPGAVMIYSHTGIDRRKNGIISVAGPVTNIVLSIIFLILAVATPLPEILSSTIGFFSANEYIGILMSAQQINAFLAAFNLLPFFILDGQKVMSWSFKIWAVTMVAAVILMFI